MQFSTNSSEKKALRMFFKVEEHTSSYRDEQKHIFQKRQSKLTVLLNELTQCHKMKTFRQDKNVKCLEEQICETLQISQDSWFGKDISMTVIVNKMEVMLQNLEVFCV